MLLVRATPPPESWDILSFDVETAFLNGNDLPRELYCFPPPDVKGINPRRLWRLLKGVFGLSEAPRLWWLRIRGDLLATGWIEIKSAPATFILKDAAGKLCGVMALHVDDGLLCGDGARYKRALEELMKRAPLKVYKPQGSHITFTGRKIGQDPHTKEISISQKGYFDDVEAIPVDRQRRKRLNDKLTEKEMTQLRSLVGKLAWPARETMPQLGFGVSEIQQAMAEATVERLLEANALLRKARKLETESCEIKIPNIELDRVCMVAFSDASFGNMPRHGSQGGYIILVCNRDVATKETAAAAVQWGSHRIKRVVKSTLASEAAALAEAQDNLEYARVLFAEMLGFDTGPGGRQWQEALGEIPGYLVVDAKSLYDSLEKPGSMPKEKRVALDLAAVREALSRDSDHARWVPTRHMLADALTKAMVAVPPYLDYVLSRGRLSLVESPEATEVARAANTG